MIQLIASDMDGTLLNEKMEISKENIAAIKKAQAAGIKFMVATGRSIEEAMPILKAAGITCQFITSNGAQIFDEDGQNISTVGIERDGLRQVVAILRRHQLYFELFTDQGGFTENSEARLTTVAQWLKSTSPTLSEAQALDIAKAHMTTLPIHDVANFDEVLANTSLMILKVFVMANIDTPSLLSAKAELLKISGLSITSSGANNIEVNHCDAKKGQALTKVADKLGIPLTAVAALGDNFNDVSMINAAGVGIAMGNAEADVKAIASYTTLSNIENGVALAVEKLVTGEWQ